MNNELILVVDDEPDNLSEMSVFLSGEGYSIIVANNGETALNLFKSQSPVLVITDYNMPKMNGLELLKHVKTKNSAIHVILVSGVADRKTIVTAMKEEAFDFLLKPVDLDILLMNVRTAIDKTLSVISAKGNTLSASIVMPTDEKKGNIESTILHFARDLDEYNVERYTGNTNKLIEEGFLKNHVILNLKNVRFINSRGLDYLIRLKQQLENSAHIMYICSLSPQVETYIKSLGYDKYFAIEQSPETVYQNLIF